MYEIFEPRIKTARNKLERLQNNPTPTVPIYDLEVGVIDLGEVSFRVWGDESDPDQVVCSICADDNPTPNIPGTVLIASTPKTLVFPPPNTFEFEPFRFQPSTNYWVMFSRTGSLGYPGYMDGLDGMTNDPYVWEDGGMPGSWHIGAAHIVGSIYTTYGPPVFLSGNDSGVSGPWGYSGLGNAARVAFRFTTYPASYYA